MKTKTTDNSRGIAPATGNPLRTAIAGHPFFCGLNEEHLETLAGCAILTQFAREELIFRQGDLASRFYLIEAGSVVLETKLAGGQPVRIQTIGCGDVLGCSWLFPPHVWHFNARTVEPTRAIFFYGTWLRDLGEADADLGRELFRRMAQVMMERLDATQIQLAEISQIALQAQLQALQLANTAI